MNFKEIVLLILLPLFLYGCEDAVTKSSEEASKTFSGIDKAEALSSTSVLLSWEKATGDDVSGYQIFEMGEDTLVEGIGLVGFNKNSYVVSSLTPLKTYRFIVRVIRNKGAKDENNFFKEVTTLAPGDLNVSPKSLVTTTSKTHQFVVKHGKPPYKYQKVSGEGLINSSTGEFVSPSSPGVSVLKVEDAAGSFAFIQVETFNTLKLIPSNTQLKSGRKLVLSASGGTEPYDFVISSGGTYGVLDSQEPILTAGAIEGNIVIKVTDSRGLQETSLISVVNEYSPQVLIGTADRTTCVTLKGNSYAKCWGMNLGLRLEAMANFGDEPGESGDATPRIELGNKYEIKKIRKGSGITCGILEDNLLRCLGSQGAGRLGNGSSSKHYINFSLSGLTLPIIDFGAGRTVKDFDLGSSFGCAILDNDQLKCWGDAYRGRLGSENASDKGDHPGEMGDNLPYVNLGTGRTVKKLAVGAVATCVILDNDRVKCFGTSYNGMLGNGSSSEDLGDDPGEMGDALPYVDLGTGRTAKEIYDGYNRFCAILDNDGLKCWGYNGRGELGIGSNASTGDSPGEMGDALPYVDLGTGRYAIDVALARYISCAILDNNDVKCWGDTTYGPYGKKTYLGNSSGEMGDNLAKASFGDGFIAKSIHSGPGADHVCVIFTNNEVKCFGTGSSGELGSQATERIGDDPLEIGDNIPVVDLGSGVYPVDVAIFSASTCFLLNDKSAKCVGENRSAQNSTSWANFGDEPGELGSNTPILDIGKPIRELLRVRNGGAVISMEDQIRNWGYQSYGRLGLGNSGDKGVLKGQLGSALPDVNIGTDRTVKAVASAAESKCAILDNDRLKCFGRSRYGQLGSEDDSNDIGGSSSTMGDNIPYVDLGSGRTVHGIAAGTHHYCALLDNGQIKCWGPGGMGKLGYGDTNNRGDDPGEMGDLLPYVDLGTGRTARQVFAGFNNSCAILDNYQVKCWGENEAGQLGQGNQNDKGDAPGEMGDNLIPIDFGTSERPIDVQIAELSICVLFESERVKCLGRGSYGVMMRGKDPGYVGNVVAELGEALNWINFGTGRRAQKIIAGQRHYCAVLDNAKVKCWGHNIHGDLGMGHFQSWGNSPSHLGDSWPYVDFGGF